MAKNMTVGKPFPTLFAFAIPMVIGNLFQQLYNVVDSMVVGNFVGEDALAAVGASSSITFLFIAIATGTGIGCSIIISQLFGAGEKVKMKLAINTSLTATFMISLALMVIGLCSSDWILSSLRVPDNIIGDASVYLKIYFMGLVFLFMYNMLNSTFNALGESKIPLVFLILSSVVNIVLDLVFVIQLNMGVAGVAWATLIAQGISAVFSFLVLLIHLARIKTEEKAALFDGRLLTQMGKMAVPSTVQQSIVSVGMIFVQGLVNSYGSIVIAGFTVASKIDTIAIMPMIQVGNAVSNFTAQNVGAGKTERIKSGMFAGYLMNAVISIGLAVILFIWGDSFIGAFMDSESSREAIGVGMEYIRVVSSFYVVMGLMNVTNGVLRGAGDVKVFMASTLCNFSIRVLAAYTLAYVIGKSAVWWAVPMGWTAGLIIAVVRFSKGKWKDAALIVR